MRMVTGLALACAAAAATLPGGVGNAAATAHSFVLTYRDFGPVAATSVFREANGYAVRFEGCFARHSEEAICGFTIRAATPLTLTNVQNSSHGADAAGSPVRTCCLFVQGDNRGFPLSAAASAPAGVAVLDRALRPGEAVGVLLRVPNYKAGAPLTAITFSHGGGDKGVQFPTRVVELP